MGLVVFGVSKLLNNNDNSSNVSGGVTSNAKNTFFLKNNDNKYGLFDREGNNITGFKFTYAKEMRKAAVVTNENDEDGIIQSNGKMLIDFGKYKSIKQYGSLFVVKDKNSNETLIDSSGKTIKKLGPDTRIHTYNEEVFLSLKTEKEYIYYNQTGKEFFRIKNIDNIEVPRATTTVEGYMLIFYNNKNYIIDIESGKIEYSFENSKSFLIYDVNENNKNELLLGTNKNNGKEEIKLIKNGKEIYSKETEKLTTLYFEDDIVILDDGIGHVLDETGNIAFNSTKPYKDTKNYLKLLGDFKGVEVYVDNQLKTTLDCNYVEAGYAKYGIYLLKACQGYGEGNRQVYFKYDGTRLNNEAYKYANSFLKNGTAIVTQDGSNYYLINTKGEKISNMYKRIYAYIYNGFELYIGTNSDNTKTLFDSTGKEMFKAENTRVDFTSDSAYATKINNNTYTVYDIRNNKDIVTVNSLPKYSDDYFITKENSKTQFYSYITGKMFHDN